MKKWLVIGVSFLFLTGCSNDNKEKNSTSSENSEVVEVISSELKGKAKEIVSNFNNEDRGITLTLNEKEMSIDVEYTSEEFNAVISKVVSDLTDDTNITSIIFIAEEFQKSSMSIFDTLEDKVTIRLLNPNDKDTPIYIATRDTIVYPAIEKENNGSLPEGFSEDERKLKSSIDSINRNNEFLYQPNGKGSFNESSKQFEVDISEMPNLDNAEIKELLISGAITAFETTKNAYSLEYPVVLILDGAEILKVENGEVVKNDLE